MKFIYFSSVVIISAVVFKLTAQSPSFRFSLETQNRSISDIPLSYAISPQVYHSPEQFSLYEITGNLKTPVPFQSDIGNPPVIWFILPSGEADSNGKRHFILEEKSAFSQQEVIRIYRNDSTLSLYVDHVPVLEYQMGIVEAPPGKDSLYRRSGFIHPLRSPGGAVLTAIQPASHIHHYGIWNPWTQGDIDGRKVDFWNLHLGEGTVRFSRLLSQTEGPVFGGFRVHHEHMDFKSVTPDHKAIDEMWDIRVWNKSKNHNRVIIDFSSTLNCPLDSGILFKAYRYGGGLGFRATRDWGSDNCTLLTSEGITRDAADGAKARWWIIEGETEKGRSGILFLSHPYNRDHPEPARVWESGANKGVENMFFNICPIRYNDWKLEHGRDYLQRYRMVVFDGVMTVEEAEEYWGMWGGKGKE